MSTSRMNPSSPKDFGCTRCAYPPTMSPSTTKGSPTPRCGRCITTSSSNRSTTGNGGNATSSQPAVRRSRVTRRRPGGDGLGAGLSAATGSQDASRTRPDLTIGFFCTSRSRRSSSSCSCRGVPRSWKDCSARTWWVPASRGCPELPDSVATPGRREHLARFGRRAVATRRGGPRQAHRSGGRLPHLDRLGRARPQGP